MSWNIPRLTYPDKVPPLEFSRWCIGFVVCLVMIVFGCLLFYYITHKEIAFLGLLILSAGLFCIFGFIFGWKMLRTGMTLENNEIITISNDKIEAACRTWSSQYLSLTDFAYVFPDDININAFKDGDEFDMIGDRSIKFPEQVTYTTLFQELLSGLRHKLFDYCERDCLEIYFLAPDKLQLSLWNSLIVAWKNLDFPENKDMHPLFIVKNYAEQVDEWLENPSKKHRLVIACNPLAVDDVQHVTSDGACAWLLASGEITENQSQEKSRLYRAVKSDTDELQETVTQLFHYQEGAASIRHLWFGENNDKKIMKNVSFGCYDALRAAGDSLLLHQHYTELIVGRQGPESHWIMVTLSLLYSGTEESNLVISQDESGIILSQIRNISDIRSDCE